VESIEIQRRADRWAVDVRDGDLDVNIVSSDIHCACLTTVRGECGQIVESKAPTDNIDAMRDELEGVGIGCGGFEQQPDRFNSLARGDTVELLGFSDGLLSGDSTNGGYGWLVAIKSSGADELIILAGGGEGDCAVRLRSLVPSVPCFYPHPRSDLRSTIWSPPAPPRVNSS
jgi:hypothetical protein